MGFSLFTLSGLFSTGLSFYNNKNWQPAQHFRIVALAPCRARDHRSAVSASYLTIRAATRAGDSPAKLHSLLRLRVHGPAPASARECAASSAPGTSPPGARARRVPPRAAWHRCEHFPLRPVLLHVLAHLPVQLLCLRANLAAHGGLDILFPVKAQLAPPRGSGLLSYLAHPLSDFLLFPSLPVMRRCQGVRVALLALRLPERPTPLLGGKLFRQRRRPNPVKHLAPGPLTVAPAGLGQPLSDRLTDNPRDHTLFLARRNHSLCNTERPLRRAYFLAPLLALLPPLGIRRPGSLPSCHRPGRLRGLTLPIAPLDGVAGAALGLRGPAQLGSLVHVAALERFAGLLGQGAGVDPFGPARPPERPVALGGPRRALRSRLNSRPEDTAPAARCDAGLCREEELGRRRRSSRRGVGSGATTRPQREKLIEAARRREIDCVLGIAGGGRWWT